MDPSTRHGTPSHCSRHAGSAEMPFKSLRPVRARVAGPGSGIDADLMKRLTLQVLRDGAGEAFPSPRARGKAAE